MNLPQPLQALTAYPQFILYKLISRPGGKVDKLPVDYRTSQVFTSDSNWQDDPNAWTDVQTAQATADVLGNEYGVGFFFTANDPFVFIDIDKCLGDDGNWSSISQEICASFNGAAIEISQSGKGLHIFSTYTGIPEHGCKNQKLGLECYHEKRFVALTGTSATGDAATDCTAMLPDVIGRYFPATATSNVPTEWNTQPVAEWSGPDDDDILIQKMLAGKGSAATVFGNKASIKDLWEGNVEALSRAYPSLNEHDPYDRSSADAALANHLSFWTGKNHERIHRLMLRSALVRDKWTKHRKYLKEMTIAKAVAGTTNVYSNGNKKTENIPPVELKHAAIEPTLTVGIQFLQVQQVKEYFDKCVYIQDRHRIITGNGSILKPEQFKATFGGYDFSLDAENDKTTRNAWEAFVENQAIRFPKVSTTCFRPEITSGAIVQEENRTMVNTYVPIQTTRTKGDVAPFMAHMNNLFPDERDRSIILSYMAAVVQFPGVKFQWCPLVQGCEGNGKSLIGRVMAYAVGNRYTHFPNTYDLGNKFNGWMLEKLLIVVEELFTSHKRELSERMKPMVTDDRIEIQQKGGDQITADNRANWLAFTNHKDAIIVTIDGRRYAIFFTPQQTAGDIVTWGMDGDYFPRLYDWLKREGGYEAVNEYLHTYQIAAEFNPAGDCQRAPATSSTAEAIELSIGSIEQEIMESIAQDRPGFAGGWISSHALEKLLASLRAERQIPINKRRMLLQQLGYDWHPALLNGRVNSVIIPEGCKPRLFIKKDHIAQGLKTPAEVVKAYTRAQKYPELGNIVDTQVNKV